MTLRIEPKTTTRRDLLMIARAATATGGAALALDSDAVAQTAGGRIKAIGFDAFTIFNPLSVARSEGGTRQVPNRSASTPSGSIT